MLTILFSTLLTGSWLGTGKAVMNPNSNISKTRQCREIALVLEQSPKRLNWKSGDYICEDLQANYGASDFQIKNYELILDGTAVGRLQDGHLEIQIQDPSDGSTFHLKLELSPSEQQLTYQEQWFEDKVLKLEISGRLIRQ